MHFISIEWLAWMSLTVGFYWLFPMSLRHHFLSLISAVFLGLYSPLSLLLLISLAIIAYGIVSQSPGQISGRRATIGSAVVIFALLYFKITVHSNTDDVLNDIVIPLGLAYYSLRLIHYLLESYKGTLPRHTLSDYVSYLFFLPTLVVGPIHRFSPFYKDLRKHHWNLSMLSAGAERILYGYVKLTFLANYLISGQFGGFIDSVEDSGAPIVLYMAMLKIGLNLYLQFSGFSDIAIGFSRLLGFRVMENFNWPFLKKNVSEFWRSWHISLTSWCREYIYTTVFSTTRSPALGAIATMIAIGLWHEVSVRYLFWGFYHGAGIAVWQQFQKVKPLFPQISGQYYRYTIDALSVLITFHFILVGFLIVRQPTLTDAFQYLYSMLFFWI